MSRHCSSKAASAAKGKWQIDDVRTFSPMLRAVYLSETVGDYSAVNLNGDRLDMPGFTEEQLRVSLGAEIARQFILENGAILTPKLGLTGGFSGLGGVGAYSQIKAGLSMQTIAGWTVDVGLLFNLASEGQTSAGAKAGTRKRF